MWSCFPLTDFGYQSERHDFPVIPGQKHIYYTAEDFYPDLENYDVNLTFKNLNLPKHFRLPCWQLNCDWRLDPDSPSYSDYGLNPYRMHLPRKITRLPEPGTLSVFIGYQQPNRESILSKLEPHLKNHYYGSVYQNKVLNKIALKDKYRFNLCFENSNSPGYHTEKIPHAWEMRTVPLYWGASTVIQDFNERSFINMADFFSDDHFVDRILHLSDDEMVSIIEEPLVNQPLSLQPLIDFFAANL